jgi:dihydroorotase
MIGMETAAAVLGQLGIGPEKLVDVLSIAPRRIFRLPSAVIGQGHEADLTLFLPEESHIFTEADIRSKSRNTAFLGKTLKGKVAGIIHRQRAYLQRTS